ncbi:MAG: hypothetical protein RBT11_09775 [Desulfobacterales bacterium]|nr:hypothetical protein [Desulfobacterales bacterium]
MIPLEPFIKDPGRLKSHICDRLQVACLRHKLRETYADTSIPSFAILFLLEMHRLPGRAHAEPCLVLNERSELVRQAGDLCFPGGGIMERLDPILAGLLKLPGMPLSRWPHWSYWQRRYPDTARRMALFLATGLRESFEEMRLNPLGIDFLGPMPSEKLILFHRVIFPTVGWLGRLQRLKLNPEVAQIIYLPLRDFFNPNHYARLHFRYDQRTMGNTLAPLPAEHPCFIPPIDNGTAPLYGATFRIVLTFLAVVFGFEPPALESLPMIPGNLGKNYMPRKP